MSCRQDDLLAITNPQEFLYLLGNLRALHTLQSLGYDGQSSKHVYMIAAALATRVTSVLAEVRMVIVSAMLAGNFAGYDSTAFHEAADCAGWIDHFQIVEVCRCGDGR